MSVSEIKDLDKLCLHLLGGFKTIAASKITRLTAPGENYGSEMLLVNLTLNDGTNNKEEYSVVAKLIPESEFFRHMFNVQVSFKMEKAFYDTLVPAWQEFQRQRGVTKVIDNFAALYGARNNLANDDDGLVDENAVLVLENLKVKGYTNVDRHKGFDLPTTMHLLSVIAKFHAVPLALKLQDVETFNKKVKPFFAYNNNQWPKPPIDDGLAIIAKALEAKESCVRLIPKLVQTSKHSGDFPKENFREPFSTISHRDLWVNNVMVKFEDGEPVDSKIVDFQMYSYDTPAVDLVFFLMTSVEAEVLKTNLDRFLEHYHRVFTETLQSLGCDTKPFSYDKFLEEMAAGVEKELAHVSFMLCFIIQSKKELTPEKSMEPPKIDQLAISKETLEKIWWMLEECDKRGWMNF